MEPKIEQQIDTSRLIPIERAAAKVGCSIAVARSHCKSSWSQFAGKVGKPWKVSEPHLDDWIRAQMAQSHLAGAGK